MEASSLEEGFNSIDKESFLGAPLKSTYSESRSVNVLDLSSVRKGRLHGIEIRVLVGP